MVTTVEKKMPGLRISVPVRPWVLLVLACVITYINQHPVRSTDTEVGECAVELTHCAPQSCAPRVLTQETLLVESALLPRLNCRCDIRCSLYGDCCVDYSESCVNETHPPVPSSKFSSYFKCITPIDQRNVMQSFVAVGSCPAGWPRDTVRNNCENETLARSQKLLTLFVNGPDEIIFKNVYCAVCHGIPEDQLDPWYLKLWSCEYAAGTGTYNFDRCGSFKMLPPLSMSSPPHRCYHNLIASCPTNATESQRALCENSTSNVFSTDGGGTVYKNRHCVACNGHPGTVFFCRDRWRPLLNPSLSFTLLFDFTKQTVSSVEERSLTGIEQPQILGSCNSWQIHDPFENVCRDLYCPAGTRLSAGVCVNAPVKETPNTNPSSQTCLQHFLSQIYMFYSSLNFTSFDEIVQGSMVETHAIEIYVDFVVAANVQESLEQLLFKNLDNSTCFPCNVTTLSMLAFSRVNTNNSWLPICEGISVDNVRIEEIILSNGSYYYNTSGHVYLYEAVELVHLTKYSLTANGGSIETSRQSLLRLCSPFGNSCPVAVFHRNEFLVSGSGEDIVFVHKATKRSFHSDDVWQLPDQTLRMCNFLFGKEVHPTWLTRLSIVSFTGSVCSLVSLSLSLLTFFIFPVLQNQPGKIIMNLMAALIMAQAVLMVGKISVQWLCVVRAALLHFAWLAVFLWMTVMASDLAKSIKSNSPPNQHSESSYKVVKLGIVAWGIPAIFVSVCYLVSRLGEDQPWAWLEYGGAQCWIVDPTHSLFAFGVPVAVLLIINCTLVIFMVYKVTANRRRLAAAQISRNLKTELLVCFKLIVITGVTWSLFFAANLVNSPIFWYVVVVVNSLQGALIGMMFLLKKRVKLLWKQKLFGVIFCVSCRRRPQEGQKADPSPVSLVRVTMTSGDASQTKDERPEIDSDLQ